MTRKELLSTNSKEETLLNCMLESQLGKSGKQSGFGMLSLFKDEPIPIDTKAFTNIPSDLELLIEEQNVLGVMLGDPFTDYWYLRYKVCNSNLYNISNIQNEGGVAKNLAFIAVLKDIESKISFKGNRYYNFHIFDNKMTNSIYISEKQYREFGTSYCKNEVYLFRVNVDTYGLKLVKIKNIKSYGQFDLTKLILKIKINCGEYRREVFEYILGNSEVGNIQIFINTIETKIFIKPSIELIRGLKEKYNLEIDIE